jgi:hypothetical protein
MNTCGLNLCSSFSLINSPRGDQKDCANAQQLGTERQIHVIKVRVAVAKTTTTVTIRGRASVA